MALLDISFFGKSIGLTCGVTVIFPDSREKPATGFPVFYLLHGLSDDHTTWSRRTSIERYVAEAGLPLIVVMPETGRGWYTNSASPVGRPYEDHLVKDVVGLVDTMFPTDTRRERRAIGGLSMGGYGAVKLALKYPERFCSATSHSGAVMTPLHKPETRPEQYHSQRLEYEGIFGPNWRGSGNDPVALAQNCPPNLRPALRLDCGTGDFLLEQNRDFHNALNALNFPHEYEEFDGEHNWPYWDLHVRDALEFHRRVLRI